MLKFGTVILSLSVGFLLVGGSSFAQTPPGACVLEDATFATGNGGCQDLQTGLVFSSLLGNGNWNQASAACDNLVEDGYSDWRLATLPEWQTACAHGVYTHGSWYPTPGRTWSSTTSGPNAYWIDMVTCATGRNKKTAGIYFAICVR